MERTLAVVPVSVWWFGQKLQVLSLQVYRAIVMSIEGFSRLKIAGDAGFPIRRAKLASA